MENGNRNEIGEFAGDFGRFHGAMAGKVRGLKEESIITLYAIYRKNARAEKMNGNGNGCRRPKPDPNAPATEKQKATIADLARKGRLQQVDVDNLTKLEASRMLGEVFGGK